MIPTDSSVPGSAISPTSTRGPSRAARPAYAAASSAASRMPSTTPPASDLCATPGSAVLSTTGYPISAAAASAAPALPAHRMRAAAIP